VSHFATAALEREGIYESEIEHDHSLPFLPHEPPPALDGKAACDVMVPRPVSLPPVAPLRGVLRVLRSTTHHGFPVVTRPVAGEEGEGAGSGGHLEGLVLRSQLLVLLRERCARPPPRRSTLHRCDTARSCACGWPSRRDASDDAARDGAVACRVFCDAAGRPLVEAQATAAAQLRIERAMRLFYRSAAYADHRAAATTDPSVASFDDALAAAHAAGAAASGAPPATSGGGGGAIVSAGVTYGELDYLPGGPLNSGVADERAALETAELATIVKSVGSAERLCLDLRCAARCACALRRAITCARHALRWEPACGAVDTWPGVHP
jgi:CBS domain